MFSGPVRDSMAQLWPLPLRSAAADLPEVKKGCRARLCGTCNSPCNSSRSDTGRRSMSCDAGLAELMWVGLAVSARAYGQPEVSGPWLTK